ncbi:hypothetical protein D9M71_396330 [compost metagenome]
MDIDPGRGDVHRGAGRQHAVLGGEVGDAQVMVQRAHRHEAAAVGRTPDEAVVAPRAPRVVARRGDQQGAGLERALADGLVGDRDGRLVRAEGHGHHLAMVGDGPVDAGEYPGVGAAAIVGQHLADVQLGAMGHPVAAPLVRRLPRPAGGAAAMGAVAMAVLHAVHFRDEGSAHHLAIGEIRVPQVQPGIQHRHPDALAAVARSDHVGRLQSPGLAGGVLEQRRHALLLPAQRLLVERVGRIAEAAQVFQAGTVRLAQGVHRTLRLHRQDRRVLAHGAQQVVGRIGIQADHRHADMLEQHATVMAERRHVHTLRAEVDAAHQFGLAQAGGAFQAGQRLRFRPVAKGHDETPAFLQSIEVSQGAGHRLSPGWLFHSHSRSVGAGQTGGAERRTIVGAANSSLSYRAGDSPLPPR